MSRNMTLKEAQRKVKEFVERNMMEASPEIRALDLISEVGEVSKEIIRMTDYGRKRPESRKELADEMGDAFFSLLCLANTLGIDMEASLDSALAKYNNRIKNTRIASSGRQ